MPPFQGSYAASRRPHCRALSHCVIPKPAQGLRRNQEPRRSRNWRSHDHFDAAGAHAGIPRQLAEPYRDHRPNIGRNVEIHRETGIFRAKIDLSPIVHDPPLTFVFGDAGEFEIDGDAPLGKNAGIDAPPHVPYQNGNVEITFLEQIWA